MTRIAIAIVGLAAATFVVCALNRVAAAQEAPSAPSSAPDASSTPDASSVSTVPAPGVEIVVVPDDPEPAGVRVE
jgi:hypothetical protein